MVSTELLDKSETNKTDIFTSNNITKKHNQTKTEKQKINKKKARARAKARKITIKKFCANYKHDSVGQENKALYDACKINQNCRKTKCKDIDKKFDRIKNSKLGKDGNGLLLVSITNKCPLDMSNKSRKKCINKATRKFYEDSNMGDIYNKVLECDKKTCSSERHNFHSALFHANKTKKRIRTPALANLEDIPDQQMIEQN